MNCGLPSLTSRGRNACLALLGATYLLTCRAVHAGMLASIPLCPFRWLTGMDCPLCGLSRAFGCLLSGHISAAVHYHRFAPELFALTVLTTALAAVSSMSAHGPWADASVQAAFPRNNSPTPPPSH